MDFKRVIYFSPLGRIISIIHRILGIFSRPFMMYGYKCRKTNKRRKFSRVSSSAIIMNKKEVEIGENVWIWHYSIIDGTYGVKIGNNCQIGAWVGVFTHSSHIAIRLYGGDSYIKTPMKSRIGYVGEGVEIGDHTFIGAKATIMPGVKIGRGSLVAAGTIVNKSAPDFSIIVGNPGVVKGSTLNLDKKYFADELVEKNYFSKEDIINFLSNQ